MAPDEVTIPLRKPLDAKNTGSAKHANHLTGDVPVVPAVQLPVKKLPKTYKVMAFAMTCIETNICATLYNISS